MTKTSFAVLLALTFALNACSNKQEQEFSQMRMQQTQAEIHKEAMWNKADFNATKLMRADSNATLYKTEFTPQELSEMKQLRKRNKPCIKRELEKAKAENKKYIRVDYLLEKCGK